MLLSALAAAAALLAIAVMALSGTARPRTDLTDGPAATTAQAVRLRAIDGGPGYFAHISPRSAWMDRHILLGGWLEQPESPSEVADDQRMGNNIYWNLAGTPGPDRVDYDVIRAGGMHASEIGRASCRERV